MASTSRRHIANSVLRISLENSYRTNIEFSLRQSIHCTILLTRSIEFDEGIFVTSNYLISGKKAGH